MISQKERELAQQLFNSLKKEFPEIELVDITEGLDDRDSIWLKVRNPEDEDREIEFMERAAEKAAHLLLEEDCYIAIVGV